MSEEHPTDYERGFADGCNEGYKDGRRDADRNADRAERALGANGYVVVPRHLLDELMDAALGAGGTPDVFRRLVAARAAVVEAVGPTREDTKP